MAYSVEYYPQCEGRKTFPDNYREKDKPDIDYVMIIKKRLMGIPLSNAKKFDKVVNKVAKSVVNITQSFGINTNSDEVIDRILRSDPSRWHSIENSLWNVRDVNDYHRQLSRKKEMDKCGIFLALTSMGDTMGEIWVFSDRRMVSLDDSISYIFAQGINSSLPYIVARMMYPNILPPVSDILIGAVENWALEQGVNAIRINPLEPMDKILVKRLGFKMLTDSDNPQNYPSVPYTDKELSPFISKYFEWDTMVVKFLDQEESTVEEIIVGG